MKRRKIRMGDRIFKLLFFYVPVAFLTVTFGIPLLYGLLLSFRAHGWSLANYRSIFADMLFWRSVYDTLILAALGLALEFTWGVGLALLLSFQPRVSLVTEICVVIPALIPEIVFLTVARYVLLPRGYLNGALRLLGLPPIGWLDPGSVLSLYSVALVDAWRVTPVVTLLLLDGVQAIPGELYEAAYLDGAGPWQRFRRITLPLLMPSIYAALLIRGADALRIFSTVLVLTGPEGVPVMSTYAYQLWSDELETNKAMAASIILALMVSVLGGIIIKLRRRTAVMRNSLVGELAR